MILSQQSVGSDGSFTCSDHKRMCKLVESLQCNLESNGTLCVNRTQTKQNKKATILYVKKKEKFQLNKMA